MEKLSIRMTKNNIRQKKYYGRDTQSIRNGN